MGAAGSSAEDGGAGGPLWCGSNASVCCNKAAGGKGDITNRGRPQAYPQFTDKSAPDAPGQPQQWAHEGDRNAIASDPQQLSYMEGTETYEDGTTYRGQLVDGRRHGLGTWTSDTESYTGEWKEDQRDGRGKQEWKDGRVYEGQFKSGKLHGHGRMEWHMPNGLMVYEGQYVDDLKDGHGRYVWPDGRIYDGGWKRGMRDGRATVTTSKGQTRQEIWREDKMERRLDPA